MPLSMLLLMALVACGGTETATPASRAGAAPTTTTVPLGPTPAATSPQATVSVPATPPEELAPTAASTAGAGQFVNPVFESNFPDPHVIRVGKEYHAYATNGPAGNVPTLRSTDLVEWTEGADAMPELAPWVEPGKTWAPEVLRRADGKYVLYYTAASSENYRQCLGRAVSSSPQGPFVDKDTKPFVCQVDEGGSIDASPFADTNGNLYLLWKNDGNCCSLPTYIYAQKLSRDGLKLVGKPARLAMQDAEWEGNLVEAPTMWKRDGKYYLFYSANGFDTEFYATGYATCKGPLGPCKDAPENPILKSQGGAAGPGHQTIIKDDDGDEWIVYHAWPPDTVGVEPPGRLLWIDQLLWKDGKPVVDGPTSGPQPIP